MPDNTPMLKKSSTSKESTTMSILDYAVPSDRDINEDVYYFAIGKINKGWSLHTVWADIARQFSGWDIGNPEAENIREEIENYYWN